MLSYHALTEAHVLQKGKTQSKKKALYGVFDDSSDDDDRHGGLGSRGKKAKKDYSAPIGFVSGGLKGQEKAGEKDCKLLHSCDTPLCHFTCTI